MLEKHEAAVIVKELVSLDKLQEKRDVALSALFDKYKTCFSETSAVGEAVSNGMAMLLFQKRTLVSHQLFMAQFSIEGKSQKMPNVVENVESSMSPKIKRKTQSTKGLWTKQEDVALVDCLVDLSKDSAWKSENGFRTGYLVHLEKLMAAKLPSTDIGLRNKEFPHLDDLMFMWGKDHATGDNAETPADAVEEINLCDEEVDTSNAEIFVECYKGEKSNDVKQAIRKSETLDSSICSSNKKPTTRKRKRKADDALDDLVGEIHKYVIAVTEANEEMKGISTYFKKQPRVNLFVPSAISLAVPLPLMSLTSEVSGTSEKGVNILTSEKMTPRGQHVFAVGIGALLFVLMFKAITGLPPYIGILLGLGVLWILTDVIHIGATLH
ncbi:hypothetical protein ZIOFF_005017 [Zingiber officinale]|uniref:Uncharacterized protein n=1 Tax=Zingiber officinale TaxID=94328 RepID=A0A8J5HTL9_ZINOF|nr:hypothetical protein ZIOFF_005017 [Zingiber officinale]